ncbi:MAG TPA: hypothetical protein VN837_16635 [Chloroflexota bacterium]|nr:hypothetical protein [Chloroflexota bacterium]
MELKFDAVAIAPARFTYLKERGAAIHLARFDLVVLIEQPVPRGAGCSPPVCRRWERASPWRDGAAPARGHPLPIVGRRRRGLNG